MAMPAELPPNDEPATKSDVSALHEEIHMVAEMMRRVFTEDNMRMLERFLANPAAKWRARRAVPED